MIRVLSIFLLVSTFAIPAAVFASESDEKTLTLSIEAGPAWQSRNNVRIPNEGGTRFSLSDLIGEGPFAAGRLTADWNIARRHSLRAVIAPIVFDGSGRLDQETTFAGSVFSAAEPTRGKYDFTSYRLGYRYSWIDRDRWTVRIGGTLFVRDAEVELRQGSVEASDSDLGVVPLLNLAAEYSVGDRWKLVAELDAAAASQGRAIDAALMAKYQVNDRYDVGFGYRTIEGGADTDDVFTFAWIHSAVMSLSIRF